MPRDVRAMSESAALTFGAAAGDRIEVPAAASIDGATRFSALLWVYPTTLAAARHFASKFSGGLRGWYFRILDTSGNLQFQAIGGGTQMNYRSNDVPLVADRWCFVAATYDSTLGSAQSHLYGGYQSTQATERTYGTSTDGIGNVADTSAEPFVIGNLSNNNTLPLQGRISACAYFTRILTLPEIRAWQFSALDEPYPAVMAGCVGLWYPGNEGGGKVLDYSGNHNDGTVTGATLSRGLTLPTLDDWRRNMPRFRAPAAVPSLAFLPEQLGFGALRGLH